MRATHLIVAASAIVLVSRAPAQQPAISRADAISAALAHSPRLTAAAADTMVATARRISAGALPDPTLAASYTKDIPQYHVTLEMPVDPLWTRGPRIAAADAELRAARVRWQAVVAQLSAEVDTTYTRAIATAAHARLSARSAADADSLYQIAQVRQAAGDASEMEVQLAAIAAGQQRNAAEADALAIETVLVDLQALIGASGALTLSDTLGFASEATVAIPRGLLQTAESEESARAATLGVRSQRRSALAGFGVLLGFDAGYPNGENHGLLPTIGVSVPIPIFNHNRGGIAEAEAGAARANADVVAIRIATQVAITHAQGAAMAAAQRAERDRGLVATATRVAAMSIQAYREGATAVANAIEGGKIAREVQGQYIDDVAALLIARAMLRMLTQPVTVIP